MHKCFSYAKKDCSSVQYIPRYKGIIVLEGMLERKNEAGSDLNVWNKLYGEKMHW